MAYCTDVQVKAALKIADTGDDSLIALAIVAAEEQINGYCERDFNVPSSETVRYFRPQDSCTVWIDDLANTTGLVVAVGDDHGGYTTTLTVSTDFQLAPYNAPSKNPVRPYTKLEATGYTFPHWNYQPAIKITGRFGWAAVPDAVTKAAIILSIDQYKLNGTAFGVVGESNFGTIRAGSGINRQAAALLAPFVKAHE